MGDVADILGMAPKTVLSAAEEAARLMNDKVKVNNKVKKPKGMSREVFSLLSKGKDSIIPAVQTNKITAYAGLQKKRTSGVRGKWSWAPFKNSARTDALEICHWVRSDINHSDYPYAKFNIKLDYVVYSDEEYEKLLDCDNWTRSETDHLMYICYQYDLRWPVIVDKYSNIPTRTIEELQARYYYVVSTIHNFRQPNQTDPTQQVAGGVVVKSTNDNKSMFSFENERNRRYQLELNFRKGNEDKKIIPGAAVQVKDEVNKKASSTNLQLSNTSNAQSTNYTKPSRNRSTSRQAAASNSAGNLADKTLELVRDQPVAGKPYVQSSRLGILSDKIADLDKTLTKKMQVLLKELGVPTNPIPTRAVCDRYDELRKDTISLLSLQNVIENKEKQLAGLRYHSLGTLQPDGFPVALSSLTTTHKSSEQNEGNMGAPLYPSGMSTISFGQPYIPSVVQPLQAPLPKKAVKRKSSTEGGDAATPVNNDPSAVNDPSKPPLKKKKSTTVPKEKPVKVKSENA
jgi:DNA methyltransferase 1-associated protein 1